MSDRKHDAGTEGTREMLDRLQREEDARQIEIQDQIFREQFERAYGGPPLVRSESEAVEAAERVMRSLAEGIIGDDEEGCRARESDPGSSAPQGVLAKYGSLQDAAEMTSAAIRYLERAKVKGPSAGESIDEALSAARRALKSIERRRDALRRSAVEASLAAGEEG